MLAFVLLVVILLSITKNVISNCPPDSGTLNVIIIECFIIDIYLSDVDITIPAESI